MKKKSIIITLCLIISILASFTVFAADDTISKIKIDGNQEVVRVDMDSLELNKANKTAWDTGFVEAIRKAKANDTLTPDDLQHTSSEIDEIVADYCAKHYDNTSGTIYDKALSVADSNTISIDLDEDSDVYKKYVNHYDIDDNTSVTITPDSIYVDEYAEKTVNKPDTISTSAKAASSWKYKDVATRRTLYKKVTANNKTYSLKIYSTHTGGQVKYNGSTAKHNSAYYAYSLVGDYGQRFTFKQIAKQSEQYSGTSWHYKYLGKITGSVSLTTPVKVKITYKETALGCQVITKKNGSVTKNYWPSL